ncbi:recombination endonuclease [Xanthomonas phage SB3]|uniref:Recombination endonuclease n=1 Tax=Xanthomonas phage SB3 TaxID=3117472 RepID=A0ABZ2GZA7_9CAUD
MSVKLKAAQVRGVRVSMLQKQGGKCALCGTPCSADQAVLDHDHSTGAVRAALHRGCNSLLGKLENNAARYGVRDIGVFSNGVAQYLRIHSVNVSGYIHPLHKTDEEKRIARNAKARKKRAATKE